MKCLVRVLAQRFKNYASPSETPVWVEKAGVQEFEFHSELDFFAKANVDCQRNINKLLDLKSNADLVYKYIDHKVVTCPPIAISEDYLSSHRIFFGKQEYHLNGTEFLKTK